MRSKRIEDMAAYIQRHKTVTLDQLCTEFDISKNTVRRDIMELLQTGDFKKIYGGISYVSSMPLKPFSERYINNPEIKQSIAKKAASLVRDGDILFLDSGTTTFRMIDYLVQKKNITILTNSLETIYHSIPHKELQIVSLSGDLNRETLSFTGQTAGKILEKYNISKAFMASTGISAEHGITDKSPMEYDLKNTAINRSRECYVLADHTKFDVASLLTYSDFTSIDGLITDRTPTGALKEALEANDTTIILADTPKRTNLPA